MDILTLHSILMSYGDIIELDYKLDEDTLREVQQLDNWIDAPNGKKGINLTGDIFNLGLNDNPVDKHAKNQPYNSNLLSCPSLIHFFDLWTELAKCRAVKMDKGSFFALHRDAYRFNEQFRIFIPLNKTSDSEWIFIYDGKIRRFKAGVPYIINTRKVHGSFATDNDIYHVLLSLYLNEHNLNQITKLLPNCNEH